MARSQVKGMALSRAHCISRKGIVVHDRNEIKKAKAGEKPYSKGDGDGLYPWVTPAGGKLWRWSYRFGGKEKLMSFRKYPDVPLVNARDKHGDARKYPMEWVFRLLNRPERSLHVPAGMVLFLCLMRCSLQQQESDCRWRSSIVPAEGPSRAGLSIRRRRDQRPL